MVKKIRKHLCCLTAAAVAFTCAAPAVGVSAATKGETAAAEAPGIVISSAEAGSEASDIVISSVEAGADACNEANGETATAAVCSEASAEQPVVRVYNDVRKTPYEKAVNSLVEKGVINGYPDGTFRPENSITRAEISKITGVIIQEAFDAEKVCGSSAKAGSGSDVKEAEKDENAHPDITDEALMRTAAGSSFYDVDTQGWAASYIGTASICGIVNGYGDNTFKPSNNITYNELAAMIVRAAEYDMSEISGSWPANYIEAAEKMGLYKGMEKFDPEENGSDHANRGNSAIMINNAFKAIQTAAADGYKAAEGKDTGTGSVVVEKLELSIDEAIEIMQTEGIQAETAALNKKKDEMTLSNTKDSIKTISDTLDVADYLSLSEQVSLQNSGVTESNLKIQKRARDFISENMDSNYQAEMNNIEQTTRKIYYGVLQAAENVEVCKESVEIEKELLRIAQKKHELGTISDIMLANQEYSLVSAESSLGQAEQSLESAESQFCMLMNVPVGTKLVLTTPLEKAEYDLPSLQECVESMNESNLSLKYYNYLSEISKMQLDSLKYRYPSTSNTYKQAEMSYEQASTGIEQAKLNMDTEMRTNYFNLSELENQIKTFESTIALTEKSIKIQTLQYDLGMITYADLNKTKLSLQQAKQGLTNAIVTYNNAVSDFKFSMGVGTSRISFQ